MPTLLEKLLNILGFYQLDADEYFYEYGYQYYIPTMQQVNEQLEQSDQPFIDVASADIGNLIVEELESTDQEETLFEVTYDFEPLIGTLGKLQRERIIDAVLDDLEKKGYRPRRSQVTGEEQTITIRWKIRKFRQFQAFPSTFPGGQIPKI